ncbi:MAG TPA: hypothetical protein DCX14_10315 [Flavobacteriales bacterium]|nr:hypothetical protein [Flavobacteriales bacterium]
MSDKELSPIVIDFATEGKELNESWLGLFGMGIKEIIRGLFGQSTVPVSVRGSRSDVDPFTTALRGEKRYIEAAKKYGLDNPRTFKNKAQLDSAISQFERHTGINWPIK